MCFRQGRVSIVLRFQRAGEAWNGKDILQRRGGRRQVIMVIRGGISF